MIPVGAIAANQLRAGGGGGPAAYRYVGARVLTTSNGYISCGQLSLFEEGSGTDLALSGTPGSDYTIDGGYPLSNIKDGNSSTFSLSTPGAAGSNGTTYIDFGSGNAYDIQKMGWRSRNDVFGAAEAPITWEMVAKQNSGDAWTVISSLPTQATWSAGEYREQEFPSVAYATQKVSTLGANSILPVYAGGTSPSFAVTAGSLPGGLSLNSSTGEISGTASATGTFSGIEISMTSGSVVTTSPAFTLTSIAGYRHIFIEVVTTGNTYIGCSTIKLLDAGSTDHALQSNGAVASAVSYSVNGSFPITNVNDGNDTSFTTSAANSAGTGVGILIVMDDMYDIDKVGYRSRSDAFGAAEAITSGYVKGRVSAADSWDTLHTVSEAGWANNEYREWTV
jgi:hypothetical protein